MRKKILIADDDTLTRMFLSGLLSAQGYETVELGSGWEVVNYLSDDTCDLILLDVLMDEMDGFVTCKHVVEHGSGIPVIIVTSLTEGAKIKEGFEAGAIDYVKKPIDKIELISRIENALRIKQAEQELGKLYDNLSEQLHVASRVQNYMLPGEIVVNDNLIFSSNYVPCQHVGGDLFDIIHLDDGRDFVYVADISGHGVQAALLMSAVKSVIHLAAEEFDFDDNVHEFMNRLNSILCESLFFKNYMTILAGVIDLKRGRFDYFNAGHPPLVGVDLKNGCVYKCNSRGSVPLGWSKKICYEKCDSGCQDLDSEIVYMLYTDGIIECLDGQSSTLGVDGFINVLLSMKDESDSLLLPQRLVSTIRSRGYDMSKDDSTLFSFRIQGDKTKSFVMDTKKMMYGMQKAGNLGVVQKVSDALEAKTVDFTGDTDLAAKASIVITEFLNNIIIHGLGSVDQSVIVGLKAGPKLELTFIDRGIEWMPGLSYAGSEEFDDYGVYLGESGRGMRMIRALSSCFKRERIGDANETVIELAGTQQVSV